MTSDGVCGPGACILTLRDLRGQWRGDGDEMALPAAIVDGHLAPLAQVAHVAVALGHEQFQGVVPVHEHAWCRRRQGYRGGWCAGQAHPVRAPGPGPSCPGPVPLTVLQQGRRIRMLIGTRRVQEAGRLSRKHRPASRRRLLFKPIDLCPGRQVVQLFKRSNPACFFFGGGALGERRGSYLI